MIKATYGVWYKPKEAKRRSMAYFETYSGCNDFLHLLFRSFRHCRVRVFDYSLDSESPFYEKEF